MQQPFPSSLTPEEVTAAGLEIPWYPVEMLWQSYGVADNKPYPSHVTNVTTHLSFHDVFAHCQPTAQDVATYLGCTETL